MKRSSKKERGWIFKCLVDHKKMKFGRPLSLFLWSDAACSIRMKIPAALSGIRLLYTQPKVTAMITVTFPTQISEFCLRN